MLYAIRKHVIQSDIFVSTGLIYILLYIEMSFFKVSWKYFGISWYILKYFETCWNIRYLVGGAHDLESIFVSFKHSGYFFSGKDAMNIMIWSIFVLIFCILLSIFGRYLCYIFCILYIVYCILLSIFVSVSLSCMHTGWGCDGNYDLGEMRKGEDVDYDPADKG